MKTENVEKISIKKIIAVIFSLALVATIYGSMGGLGANLGFFALEMWLHVTLFCATFYLLKENKLRFWLALLPLIIIYSFSNYFYFTFARVFKLVDVDDLPELILVLPYSYIAVFVIFSVVIFILYKKNIELSSYRRSIKFMVPLLFLILVSKVLPETYVYGFNHFLVGEESWNERGTVQHNGYISSTLYYEAKRLADLSKTSKFRNRESYAKNNIVLAKLLKENSNKRNIHLIILESFFDPSLFEGVPFTENPINKQLVDVVSGRGSLIVSPVFGGGTAQAEFEALCGVPALREVGSVEFNLFTGVKAYCMPEQLKMMGYRVVATNASQPIFFNAYHAYKGVGFDEQYYPKEYSGGADSYFKVGQSAFDGDLLNKNLEFVSEHIKNDSRPIFNYVLGIYGHFYHYLDQRRHPLRIKTTQQSLNDNQEFIRAVNQAYYRTSAIAEYIRKLKKIDPNSLVIIFGDHLPPLGGINFYSDNKYLGNMDDAIHTTRAYYVFGGKVTKEYKKHQYEIKNIIMDYVTDHRYCSVVDCAPSMQKLRENYMKIIAHAIE